MAVLALVVFMGDLQFWDHLRGLALRYRRRILPHRSLLVARTGLPWWSPFPQQVVVGHFFAANVWSAGISKLAGGPAGQPQNDPNNS